MQFLIERRRTNDLYTEGVLFINGNRQALTVESSEVMLSPGTYRLVLANSNAHKRQLVIKTPRGKPTGWHIGTCHSWKGSKSHKTIGIGEVLKPGILFKGSAILERIFKRLEKVIDRHETIELVIDNTPCVVSAPISFWSPK